MLQAPGGRRRRASTSSIDRRLNHPRAERYAMVLNRVLEMRMRFPAHVWAMLCSGHEIESVELVQAPDNPGIRTRFRWREHVGERGGQWDSSGLWKQWKFARRMVWTKISGVWRGEWKWEKFDLGEPFPPSYPLRAGGAILPQEVLLLTVSCLKQERCYDVSLASDSIVNRSKYVLRRMLSDELVLCAARGSQNVRR